jgi:hypothetical protein
MQLIAPTINSLLAQTAHIDEIMLWIPRAYKRRNFDSYSLPNLPPCAKIYYCDTDYGPATKILPAIKFFRGQDVQIIYCDDDQIYAQEWAGQFLKQSKLFPNQCLTTCGKNVQQVSFDFFCSTLSYKTLNKWSGGMLRSYCRRKATRLKPGDGPVDICQGYGGVLVEPHFLPDTAFDIPEILWTVDDVWLSGQLAINAIQRRQISSQKRWQQKNLEAYKIAPLKKYVREDCRRVHANMMCVNFFRQQYNIWA